MNEEDKKRAYFCRDDPRPLIPEGIYEAVCTAYEEAFVFGKTLKLFLHFKIITPGEHLGTTLFMAFNIGKHRKLALGSRYYKYWLMMNGWQRPSRNAKMSPRIFLNKSYEVFVKIVKPELNGIEMPANCHYSIIEQLVRVNTGAGV